jgi:hypothetical protein
MYADNMVLISTSKANLQINNIRRWAEENYHSFNKKKRHVTISKIVPIPTYRRKMIWEKLSEKGLTTMEKVKAKYLQIIQK